MSWGDHRRQNTVQMTEILLYQVLTKLRSPSEGFNHVKEQYTQWPLKFSITRSSKILGKKELNTYAANKTTDNYSD